VSEHKPTVFEHDHPAPVAAGGAAVIFLILAGLTAMALMIGFLELGPAKVWASLAVAVIQAVVLSVFFMDLKHADKQTWLIAAAGIFWTFLLFLFTLTDYLTRHLYAF
jgi:caa(3)-type oxidase subunit IV